MSETTITIAVLYIAFFSLHSILASLPMKEWVARHWPELMPRYRIFYNLLAVVMVTPLLVLVWRSPGETLWEWHGAASYIANGLAILACIAFVFSLKMYDMSEFFGLRQLREHVHAVKDQEQFKIGTFHRYVRHPWYAMLLVLIWTRDMGVNQLVAYLLITLYLYVGSKLEERKLIAYHGEVYRRYRERVAGLIPLPWKHLSKAEAEALLEQYRRDHA